ncbi:MAG: amidohydrolase family protein [Pirellulaceae bacterium]
MSKLGRISRRTFLAAAGATCGAAAAPGLALAAGENAAGSDFQRIDCHLHINHKRRSLADTLRHIEATGTDKAFILPLETGEGGLVLKSETVLEAREKHPHRIIPFCQSDVRRGDLLRRIRTYHELGCRGVGEQKEHLPLSDRRLEGLIALCDELNWPITIHFQDGEGGYNQGLAEQLEKYLKKYKRVRIIGHAQTWWANISADVPPAEKTLYPKGPVKPGGLLDHLLGTYENVYADLSAGSGYGALTRDESFTAGFLERHRKKLLFGSDCPCTDGRGGDFGGVCYSTRLQSFLERMIDDRAALKDIYHDNALRALTGKA